jgi:regulator of RNase E activity RraA
VIPAAEVEEVITRGLAAVQREAETRQWLDAGKTLDDIDALRSDRRR